VPPPTLSDVLDSPDAIAAELAYVTPGPDGAMPISLLDAATLSHAARVDLLVAIERHAAWVAALQQEVLAAMAADPASAADEVDRSGRDWMREDVSCALRLSGVTAQRRLDIAQALIERISATLTLLRRGEISYLHAMVLARQWVAWTATRAPRSSSARYAEPQNSR
jgi:hypothetical protein